MQQHLAEHVSLVGNLVTASDTQPADKALCYFGMYACKAFSVAATVVRLTADSLVVTLSHLRIIPVVGMVEVAWRLRKPDGGEVTGTPVNRFAIWDAAHQKMYVTVPCDEAGDVPEEQVKQIAYEVIRCGWMQPCSITHTAHCIHHKRVNFNLQSTCCKLVCAVDRCNLHAAYHLASAAQSVVQPHCLCARSLLADIKCTPIFKLKRVACPTALLPAAAAW